jgi:hypothetical protein
MALTAAHFLPNNILFLLCLFSLINFANVAVLCSRLNFPFPFVVASHLLISILFYGRVVWLTSCVSQFFVSFLVFGFFGTFLHMRCRRGGRGKMIVWIHVVTDCRMVARGFYTCLTSFTCAVPPVSPLLSSFYPSILGRFVIKHFSLNTLRFRTIVTFVPSGCFAKSGRSFEREK